MMDLETTRHLADLSKIAFTDDELNEITAQMREIVALMDTIADFDAPAQSAADRAVPFADFRADRHAESFPRSEILANAKDRSETCFRVPKVV